MTTQNDATGKKIRIGDTVTVDPQGVTDPWHRKGQTGTVISIDAPLRRLGGRVIEVEFKTAQREYPTSLDATTGYYDADTLIREDIVEEREKMDILKKQKGGMTL